MSSPVLWRLRLWTRAESDARSCKIFLTCAIGRGHADTKQGTCPLIHPNYFSVKVRLRLRVS